MTEFSRPHPATVIFNLGRVFFLIIIPVIRGFFSALTGGLESWLNGAWADIFVFLVMIAVAFLSWFFTFYKYDDKRIELKSGLFIRRYVVIPRGSITAFAVKELFFLRLFNAVRLSAGTLGGNRKRDNFSVLLSPKRAKAFVRQTAQKSGEPRCQAYTPSTALIALMSLLTSSSFGGVLVIGAFLSQSGKLFGEQFSAALIGRFEEIARAFAFGLPPAAAATGYILIIGWIVGFCLSFVRYKNFTLVRNTKSIDISGGVFTKRSYYINVHDISFIDIREHLMGKIFKLRSLYLSAAGYGKHKDDISYVIPTAREAVFDAFRNKIFPELCPAPRQVAPKKRVFLRFAGRPAFNLFLITACVAVFSSVFPAWDLFFLFTGLMALIPATVFLAVRIIDYKTSGLAIDNGNYILRYSSGFVLHTAVIPKDKIAQIEIRQGLFAQMGSSCDLIIYSKSERQIAHRCRGLLKSELEKLFD